jgi:hypothetical protein
MLGADIGVGKAGHGLTMIGQAEWAWVSKPPDKFPAHPGVASVEAAPHRFSVLDSWRGIAALCVALYHLSVYSHFYSSAFIRNAYLFVDFFFVLSGFVIAYNYSGTLNNVPQIAAFMVRRFGRLWPLHVSILAFLFGLELLKLVAARHGWVVFAHVPFDPAGYATWDSLATNFFLIQSFGLHSSLTWNAASWSICTEFWAYLVFASLCCLGRRALIAGTILFPALGLAVILAFSKDHMNVGYDYGMFRCLYGFFGGYAVFRLWQWQAGRAMDWIRHCEIPALIVAILFIAWGGTNVASDFAPFVFGLIVFVFAFEKGRVSAALRRPAALYLGKTSYSIYMVHAVVAEFINFAAMGAGRVAHRAFMIDLPGVAVPILSLGHNRLLGDLVVPLYLAAVIALAGLTYRLIEERGRAFFNNLVRHRMTRSVAVAEIAMANARLRPR